MCVHMNNDGSCSKRSVRGHLWLCIGDKCPDYVMSRADRFRSMTDQQLAAYIAGNNIKSICDIVCGDKCRAVMQKNLAPHVACREAVEKMLRQPVHRKEATAEEWAQAVERLGEKDGTGSD